MFFGQDDVIFNPGFRVASQPGPGPGMLKRYLEYPDTRTRNRMQHYSQSSKIRCSYRKLWKFMRNKLFASKMINDSIPNMEYHSGDWACKVEFSAVQYNYVTFIRAVIK